jgi:hypothetical protein
MTKLTLGSHPFLLGFDQLERLVERTAKSGNDGYPPYNIEQRGENAYRITLAVAGFAEDDLSITVEDRQLVVRGRQSDEDAPTACSCIAASPRGSSSAASCWPTGSRSRARPGERPAAYRPEARGARQRRADDQDHEKGAHHEREESCRRRHGSADRLHPRSPWPTFPRRCANRPATSRRSTPSARRTAQQLALVRATDMEPVSVHFVVARQERHGTAPESDIERALRSRIASSTSLGSPM